MADDLITKKITDVQNFTNGDLGTIIQVQGDEIGQTSVSTLKRDITNSVVSELTQAGGVSLNLVNMKGVVPTYADLALITPTPEVNYAYQVEADGLVYVYTENGFQADGDGFNVQPEPTGIVEEGNTQAVSGGEVYEKLNEEVPNRLNPEESTNTPSMFPSASQIGGNFGVEILNDNDSPTASIIGKKRRFFNNTVADYGASFRIYPIQLGVNRPQKISVSFRAKRAELEDIFISTMRVYLGLGVFTVNRSVVLSGTATTQTINPSINEYNSATLRAKLVEESEDGWCRIELLFYDIAWKETFTGTFINYYFLFNDAKFYQKTFDSSDWTLLFNDEVKKGIIYGGYNYEFPSNIISLKTLQNSIDILNTKVLSSKENLKVQLDSDKIYISNSYSENYDLVRKISINRQSTFTNNPNINFDNEYLIPKNGDLKNSSLLIKTSNDDITPVYLNNSYIGGNHSWNQGVNVVATSHGKTLADVGSVYKNTSNVEFVILRIVDTNNLWMISKNQATNGYSYSFVAPSGTLIYVSNGLNTSNITVGSSTSLGNTFTTVTNSDFKVLIDENEVSDNKIYDCSNVKIVEEYSVLDLPSIIDNIISNRPSGGYSSQPQLNSFNSNKLFKNSIVYEVQNNGVMLITTNFRTYNKKIDFSFSGFVQAGALGSGNIYVPKTLPITIGAKTYNLNLIDNWTTAPSAAINIMPVSWEYPLSPPDRVINLNSDTVFHTGYLTDRGVGINRKDKVSRAVFLNTSRKLYPMGDSIARVLNENSFISCVAFRSFENPAKNPIGRTSLTHFEIGNEAFVYVDYHGMLNDVIEVPAEWNGRKVEVLEKVGDLKLLTEVVAGNIEIMSNVSIGNYGFFILKIK